MKRLLTIILFIFHVAMMFAYVGEHLEVDGIWYTITEDATSTEKGKVKVGKIVTKDGASYLYPMHKSGDLIIPEIISYRQQAYVVEAIEDHAFDGADALVSVYLPSTIETIGKKAFFECSSLVKINLDNIKSFGYNAFENCTSLSDVSFSKKDQVDIGSSVFKGCTSLTSLTFYKAKLDSYCFKGCVNLEKVVFMEYVDLFGSEQFYGSHSLSTIIFSSQGCKMGSLSFAGLKFLKYFYYPSTDETYLREGEYEYPRESTFRNSNTSATLFVAEGMRDKFKQHSIWSKAFKYILTMTPCSGEIFGGTINVDTNDVAIDLEIVGADSNQVNIISTEDFSGDTLIIPRFINLDKFKFDLNGIEANVFQGKKLKHLRINEGLEWIGKESFADCVNLESVTIPKSVNDISNSFIGCKNIKDVTVSWYNLDAVSVDATNFMDLPSNAVLHVPAGTLEKYQSHPVWGRFPTIVEASPISINSATIQEGGESVLSICLRNNEDVAGIQFKLNLPNGISLNESELSAYSTARAKDMLVIGHKDIDSLNTYNFIMVSLKEEHIKSGSGEILRLNVYNNSLVKGVYDLGISDIYIASSKLETQQLMSSASEINVVDHISGDVNNDGLINITDAIGIVNHILQQTPSVFVEGAADVNQDGIINVTDAISVINKILKVETELSSRQVPVYDEIEPQ